MLLAGLELSHPTWRGGTVAEGVAAAGAWWIPLHLLLIIGYAALAWWTLQSRLLPRILLATFLVCNTVFLVVDGVAVGVLAQTDPTGADELWSGALTTLLANASGALWCASLLAVAMSDESRVPRSLAVLTWLVFVAGGFVPYASLAATPMAVATGVVCIYLSGARSVPSGLLALAAVTRQHAGGDAAIGMLWIALAQFYRTMRP